jgi:hypothetical protein
MKLAVFLSFNGQAEEAFRFYANLFQTEIKGLVRASEMLDPAVLPAEKQDKIAWIALDTENLTLHGEDVGIFNDLSIPSNHQPNQWLVLSPDSREEADELFAKIAEGGQILYALENQVFAKFYGRLIDRFGIGWDVMMK